MKTFFKKHWSPINSSQLISGAVNCAQLVCRTCKYEKSVYEWTFSSPWIRVSNNKLGKLNMWLGLNWVLFRKHSREILWKLQTCCQFFLILKVWLVKHPSSLENLMFLHSNQRWEVKEQIILLPSQTEQSDLTYIYFRSLIKSTSLSFNLGAKLIITIFLIKYFDTDNSDYWYFQKILTQWN